MPSHTKSLLTRYAAWTLAMGLCVPLAGLLNAHAVPVAKKQTGQQIYRDQCAACHGPKGEGTKLYSKPLAGDRSVGELARFIAEYMPPGAPRKLPQADADKAAAYIHGAFYSSVARSRNKPVRIELSRLTVRQYRNALADLIGSFPARPGDAARPDERRGLRGEYFKIGQFRAGERVLERVDPQIHFKFGAAGPLREQADPYQFAMRWEGSVLAPETGEYEFIVRTEHAARLWINDARRPIIDASVKSGSGNEYRASLFLLGGRCYPLRLEFSKGVQGVENLEKLKQKPPVAASVALAWKRPHLASEIIPQRCLFPSASPETFVAATPFPPDDRSLGYERGTSVSKAWDEASTEAAIETAGYVASRLRALSGVADDAPDRDARLRAFCRRFVERAFRRPLSDEQISFFVERQFEQARDAETAVKRVVLLTLKSPRFLYREVTVAPDAYDTASRLAFSLWDSLPDEALLKAAAAGQLSTREQIAGQAERMIADPRARTKVREFFLQWLKIDQYPDLTKDAKRYPGFDATVAADLRTSLELTLDDAVWGETSDFRRLMLGDKLFLNGRLARIYGSGLAPDAPFQRVTLDNGKRTGLLTHPYLLSGYAYSDATSPIHRGVLISRSLLGRVLPPPPAAFVPLAARLHPKLTTRERVALQTSPAACASCHSLINPLGFTLEKFDAIGRLRPRENGRPIDASGGYRTRAGKQITFADSRDLARFLAGSEEVHAAFVEKLFQHLVKQPVRAFGPGALPDLQRTFEANECSMRDQIVETAVLSALKG